MEKLQKERNGYTDAITEVMVEKRLGFKELHESERQKIQKAAQEFYNKRRRSGA